MSELTEGTTCLVTPSYHSHLEDLRGEVTHIGNDGEFIIVTITDDEFLESHLESAKNHQPYVDFNDIDNTTEVYPFVTEADSGSGLEIEPTISFFSEESFYDDCEIVE